MDCVPVLEFFFFIAYQCESEWKTSKGRKSYDTTEKKIKELKIQALSKTDPFFSSFLNFNKFCFKQSIEKKMLSQPELYWNLLHTFPRWMIFLNGTIFNVRMLKKEHTFRDWDSLVILQVWKAHFQMLGRLNSGSKSSFNSQILTSQVEQFYSLFNSLLNR